MAEGVIRLQDIWKTYRPSNVEVHALKGVSLTVGKGEYISIMGPSGSGKTTLLNIIGCLDRPTGGQYFLDDREVSDLSDDELSITRSRKIGFVFQSYNLVSQLTVLENIGLPLFYQAADENAMMVKAREFANLVGLDGRHDHRPSELSGGQQQRVAIARALINDSLLILADEPTGNLDSVTGMEILELLRGLNRKGKTLIVVTHDNKIAEHSHRIIKMLDGVIIANET
jgi:putative ABC transport system ATP-binding protein